MEGKYEKFTEFEFSRVMSQALSEGCRVERQLLDMVSCFSPNRPAVLPRLYS